MIVTLPNSVFLGNFEKLLNGNTFPQDESKIQVVSPYTWVSLHPLVDSMLTPITDASTVVLPLVTFIKNSVELEEYFDHELPKFELNSQDILLAKYIISEIIRNTLEHANAPVGAILSVVYSKKSNTLRIGIADRGVGIRSSIRTSHQVKSDYDAIITALTPGITGTTHFEGGSTQNAGAGLFFVKSLAVQLQSHFLVYSGTGLFKLLKRKTKRTHYKSNSTEDHASGGNNFPSWRGTAVGIDIPLGVMDDFSTTLSHIRSSFYESLQNRLVKSRAKPQFI